jgi:hypothetical protein
MKNASESINSAMLQLEGVTAHKHRFGGTEYLLGKREIGHVHGNYLVDIPFPKQVRNEIVSQGLAEPHHILPESGWISFYIRHASDIEKAIDLLTRSYNIALKHNSQRT